MQLLIVYDIATTDPAGAARLRSVAKVCEGFGHRVQKSVFEADLDRAGQLKLVAALRSVIDPDVDSVGIYRLLEPYEQHVVKLGAVPEFDHRKPYVL